MGGVLKKVTLVLKKLTKDRKKFGLGFDLLKLNRSQKHDLDLERFNDLIFGGE